VSSSDSGCSLAAGVPDAAMDAAELHRLTSALLAAVTAAERLLREEPTAHTPKLRELIRHTRELHELLLEGLLQFPTLSTVENQWPRDRPARVAYDPTRREALTL
jgi:hypothetical protein